MATKITVKERPAQHESLVEYVERSYLNYSMFVILDRALPQLADGLKPVQRRIIYAMSELGLASSAKYKKSARTIGDVLGKFHPHGDLACYEAMVLMAQSFSTRYPLIDGQGNWGSVDDPKSFAAMRYTEARLTPYAQLLLNELSQNTTDWQPNFDNTLLEPKILPAQIPNLLLNGASGIAVGMATDIPSHNLNEVMDACLLLLDDDRDKKETPATIRSKVKKILKIMPMPDFPCGGKIISSPAELEDIYVTGRGSIRVRANYKDEGQKIIVDELPPQTSILRIMEQLRQQMLNRKLPMVADLRDESDDENPIRLVISLRRGSEPEPVMAHLFATTELERTARINLNVIGGNNKPQTQSIYAILAEWLDFRRATVTKRLQERLDKVLARLHILAGLLEVYLNLDEVIKIIRANDEPKPILMKKLKLSEQQVEAILETRLRHLAKLEEEKIRGEEETLTDERYYLEQTLGSKRKITALMKGEFTAIKKQFGDARKTRLLKAETVLLARALKQEHTISREAVTLVVSQRGWVRLAKGHNLRPEEFSYRDGDGLLCAVEGFNDRLCVFLDSSGRAYTLPAADLPSARGLGEPLSSRLEIADGMTMQGAGLWLAEDQLLLAAKTGYAFIAEYQHLLAKGRKRGKQVMKIKDNVGLAQPVLVPRAKQEEHYILCLTEAGRILAIALAEPPRMQTGRGNMLIKLSKGDRLKQTLILRKEDTLILDDGGEQEAWTPKEWRHYRSKSGNKGTVPGILKKRDLEKLSLSIKAKEEL